ncbi:MAG TPA: response regulator [Spirochaetota bacterium]|nr:response regulator [Spirochaetota bacterium]HOM37643.1 response regulator [Spirochaetota bacterium]HPQ49386.1 response regulator [Spirochaetota bacterium]
MKTVFSVEDSLVVRNIIKQVLQSEGFNVLEAENGKQALEIINSKKPKVDIYILDVNMPEMDGITLLGEIRKFDTTTPVVMLTTETDKSKIMKAKGLGATGWIIKPFEREPFLKVIRMLLEKEG